MIYAVIIVICLAIAFIILARRLPKALEGSATAASFAWPKVGPRLVKPPGTRQPRKWHFSFKLPKMTLAKLPRWLQRSAPVPPVVPVAPVNPDARPKEDFWAEAEKPEPVRPTITPPVSFPATAPLPPTRGRNLTQEAEDAFAIKDYKKAERLYLRLATEDPKNTKIYGRLGVIYLEQKNYEDARDALQAAIHLEPQVANRHFNLALAYLQLGSKAKAINAMESALKYDPSNRKYRKMLDDILAGRA